MRIALIGLGRMGANISRRLMRGGHEVVGFDRDSGAVRKLSEERCDLGRGFAGGSHREARSPEDLLDNAAAGSPTEATVAALTALAQPGDIIIDGGNSFWKDDVRRYANTPPKSSSIISDVGVSGGVWGLERGYCMMIGGRRSRSSHLDPFFKRWPRARHHCADQARKTEHECRPKRDMSIAGRPGAGHFVKMVHNGIEYGLMQAYAEGFDVLKSRAGRSARRRAVRPQFERHSRGLAARQRHFLLVARPHLDRARRGSAIGEIFRPRRRFAAKDNGRSTQRWRKQSGPRPQRLSIRALPQQNVGKLRR